MSGEATYEQVRHRETNIKGRYLFMKINLSKANLSKRDLHELFMSAILPRPIAWVSTVGENGVFNLAPFSAFAPIGLKPALVVLGITWKRDLQKKDTLRNIEDSKEFVINVVTEDLAQPMNQTCFEYSNDVSEFKEVGLTPLKSEVVKAPRLAESPVNMECRALDIMEFGNAPEGGHVIIGEVLIVHIKDEFWAGDQIDMANLKAIGRLGGDLYCRTTSTFEMHRP
jgi:flavin reductase (DIM6/NTAB) family NADH-FMN oxidoreductase RutF